MVNMIDTTLSRAAMELEELRLAEEQSSHNNKDGTTREALLRNNTLMNIRFPSNCLQLLFNIPGNTKCVDCGASNPQWATLSYGSLLCIECSGRHRQMGVHVSVVRSITMDAWKHSEILAMLEGGNKQLGDFFDRHDLPPSLEPHTINGHNSPVINRYKTNAAKFYKKNLSLHVEQVKNSGIYQGREMSRKPSPEKPSIKRRYDVKVGEERSSGSNAENKSCTKNECEKCVGSVEAKA